MQYMPSANNCRALRNIISRARWVRAATSVVLNIAEGSTSQSDAEQARFLGFALRSLVETVACQHLINRRQYLGNPETLLNAYRLSEKLFAKLYAFRSSLSKAQGAVREESALYEYDADTPF